MNQRTYTQKAQALGTEIEISIVGSNIAEVELIFTTIWQKVEQFENRFSRFISESELSYFTLHAGEKVTVSDDFLEILTTVKRVAKLSEGLFNPFLLPALQRAGYVSSMKAYSSGFSPLHYETRRVVSASRITTSKGWAQIPSNTALDFGGIGKGYLADQIASVINKKYDSFCVSMGGDIFVSGKPAEKVGWDVAVQSAVDTSHDCARVVTKRKTYAVATSGQIRSTEVGVQPHIIDPRTLLPVDSETTLCTVLAPTVLIADVMASCVLIGGEDFARTLIQDKLVIGLLMQKNDGSIIQLGSGFTLSKAARRITSVGA